MTNYVIELRSQVMNGPSSATYMSPMERRKRQQEPFAQLLAEKPLNEVRNNPYITIEDDVTMHGPVGHVLIYVNL
jgi:hypothetical protein